MKKILFILGLLIVVFTSCKKDDAVIVGEISYNNATGESLLVSGATVRLYPVGLADDGVIQGGSNLTPLAEVTTDADGKYAFTGLEEGNYWITAVATIDGVDYGTSPFAPVGVYLPKGQSETKDISISVLD
jgi:hypothetical protein